MTGELNAKNKETTFRVESVGAELTDSQEDYEAVAAVVSALTMLLGSSGTPNSQSRIEPKKSTWKFSGFWWARPVPIVRARPY